MLLRHADGCGDGGGAASDCDVYEFYLYEFYLYEFYLYEFYVYVPFI